MLQFGSDQLRSTEWPNKVLSSYLSFLASKSSLIALPFRLRLGAICERERASTCTPSKFTSFRRLHTPKDRAKVPCGRWMIGDIPSACHARIGTSRKPRDRRSKHDTHNPAKAEGQQLQLHICWRMCMHLCVCGRIRLCTSVHVCGCGWGSRCVKRVVHVFIVRVVGLGLCRRLCRHIPSL